MAKAKDVLLITDHMAPSFYTKQVISMNGNRNKYLIKRSLNLCAGLTGLIIC